ncbi:MAG: chorismate lyase [Thermodesulfobacteriota bacterium]
METTLYCDDWLSAGEWEGSEGASALGADQKELILSGGSLTLRLEALFGSKVEVEMKRRRTSTLSPEMAAYLEEEVNSPSMEREVWLTVEGKRLVYAHTVIPLECIERGLVDVLTSGEEPLGRVLADKNVPFMKERLGLGTVRCAEAATDLGVDVQTSFFARRQLLFNRNKTDVWVIKAAVTELFSPGLVSAIHLSPPPPPPAGSTRAR